MCTSDWSDLFSNAKLINLVAPVSDHNPIMVDTSHVPFVLRYTPFRFENKWLEEPDLRTVIDKCWRSFHDLGVINRLGATVETLSLWGNHIATTFKKNNEELELKIKQVLECTDELAGVQLVKAKTELGNLLLKEEAHWRQRAKVYWLWDGDLNIKFFHQSASTKKRANKIHRLRDDLADP
ncbi:hypothetical protein ACS0TY_011215 [Phlomoides rotata]